MLLRHFVWVIVLGAVAFVSHAADFKPGDDVQVEKGTKWLKARIVEVKAGQYRVHYDGLDAAFDELVPAAKLRLPVADAQPPVPAKPKPPEALQPPPAKPAADAPLGVGSEVDVKWVGEWRPGKIVSKSDTGWIKVEFSVDGMKLSPTLPPEYIRPRAAGGTTDAGGRRPDDVSAPGPNNAATEDNGVKLTQPVSTGVVYVKFAPANTPWTYVPSRAPTASAVPAGYAAISLTGGTRKFFEEPTLFCVGKANLALVGYKDRKGSITSDQFIAQAQLIDLASGKVLVDWVPLDNSEVIAASPDGKSVLCRSNGDLNSEGRLDLWTIDAGKAKRVMSWRPSPHSNVDSAEFVDNTHVITRSSHTDLILWEVPAARAIWQLEIGLLARPMLSDDRRTIVVEVDDRFGVFETLSGKCLGALPPEADVRSRAAISPDGTRLALCQQARFSIWSLEKPTVLLEIGQPVWFKSLVWVADDLLLAEDHYFKNYLVDAKLGVVVWRVGPPDRKSKSYRDIKLAAGGGWRIETETTAQKKEYTLTGGPLPLDAARKMAARIKPGVAYLFAPGDKVSIDISQPAMSAESKTKAIASLTAQLKAIGVDVAEGQPMRLILTKTPGQNANMAYRAGGALQTVNYTIQQYTIKLMAADTLAWEMKDDSGMGPFVMSLQPGVTVQEVLNKNMEYMDQFFVRVRIPRLIAQPSTKPGFGETPLGQ